MKTVELNNSIYDEINKTISWQYDNAPNLIQLLHLVKSMFAQSTSAMWNQFVEKTNISDIEECDDFGLAVWGKILNCPRPTYLSTASYRKILVGRLRLLNSNATVSDYLDYIEYAFDDNVKVADGNNMGLTFTEKTGSTLSSDLSQLITNDPEIAFVWPAGVRDGSAYGGKIFGFDGQNTNKTASDPTVGTLGDEVSFYWR